MDDYDEPTLQEKREREEKEKDYLEFKLKRGEGNRESLLREIHNKEKEIESIRQKERECAPDDT